MAKETYQVPLGPARAEINVLNSRFIASLDYVETVEEARNFVSSIRDEFPDASHNVPAFIVGGGNSITEFCSDDGEPSGTSGRPLLSVLHGSGLGNVAVVVTRYFGGTLLGTGGLVKAYSEAGKKVLEATRRGELVEVVLLSAAVPYRLFEPFRSAAETSGGKLLSTEFAELVRVEVEIPLAALDGFRSRCADLSGGELSLTQNGQRQALMPLT
ncbi:MAG: YigZ family protein [Spirochaetia bacterium]|jgi:uncharacterized YigZ family protein|nr:YigZ family protein [Spirochaetia bacterium]